MEIRHLSDLEAEARKRWKLPDCDDVTFRAFLYIYLRAKQNEGHPHEPVYSKDLAEHLGIDQAELTWVALRLWNALRLAVPGINPSALFQQFRFRSSHRRTWDESEWHLTLHHVDRWCVPYLLGQHFVGLLSTARSPAKLPRPYLPPDAAGQYQAILEYIASGPESRRSAYEIIFYAGYRKFRTGIAEEFITKRLIPFLLGNQFATSDNVRSLIKYETWATGDRHGFFWVDRDALRRCGAITGQWTESQEGGNTVSDNNMQPNYTTTFRKGDVLRLMREAMVGDPNEAITVDALIGVLKAAAPPPSPPETVAAAPVQPPPPEKPPAEVPTIVVPEGASSHIREDGRVIIVGLSDELVITKKRILRSDPFHVVRLANDLYRTFLHGTYVSAENLCRGTRVPPSSRVQFANKAIQMAMRDVKTVDVPPNFFSAGSIEGKGYALRCLRRNKEYALRAAVALAQRADAWVAAMAQKNEINWGKDDFRVETGVGAYRRIMAEDYRRGAVRLLSVGIFTEKHLADLGFSRNKPMSGEELLRPFFAHPLVYTSPELLIYKPVLSWIGDESLFEVVEAPDGVGIRLKTGQEADYKALWRITDDEILEDMRLLMPEELPPPPASLVHPGSNGVSEQSGHPLSLLAGV